MTARHFACAAILLAAFPPGAAADKPRIVRPAGKDATVDVMRGESVHIPLRGFERNLNRVVYRVLEKPRHGSLSNLVQYDGPERQGPGYVTYTHGDDDDSTEDEFTFEVRAPATKLAGRGRVRIRIVDMPAKLHAPAVLDFGRVAVGDPPARRNVELANIGGGVLRGSLEVPAPFARGDGGDFVLRRGRSVVIPVLFAPERAGPYSFPVQPVLGDPATVILRGEALAPFFVEAKETKFSVAPDGSRKLVAGVVNNSQTPREIAVDLPSDSPVEPVAPFTLAPGASEQVVLRIPPLDKTGLSELRVHFKDGEHEQMLTLDAPAMPAELVVVEAPDFGVIHPRRTPKAFLVLRNEGGTVAEGRLQESDTVVSAEGAPAFRIEPGEEYSMELELRLAKDAPPPTKGALTFRGADFSFDIKAVVPPPTTPTPAPALAPAPAPPSAPEWTLNGDIQCTTTPDGVAIRWTEKEGWNSVAVQHQSDAATPWRNYQLPARRAGFLGWLQSLPGRIRGFFEKPIDRTTIEELSGEQEKFGQALIAADAPGSADLWRLQASPASSDELRPVSPVFRIEADRKLVAVPGQPEPVVSPTTAPAGAVIRPRPRGPVTAIRSSGITPERRGAIVQITLDQEIGVRGFRLERGAMVSSVDPKTGIPQGSEFQPIEQGDTTFETVFFGEGEAGGRKLTVCTARIGGLPAGTRTFWRLIPAGPSGDLPPTEMFSVDTLPVVPVPWSGILLAVLFVLLAGILYLRWKINRASD